MGSRVIQSDFIQWGRKVSTRNSRQKEGKPRMDRINTKGGVSRRLSHSAGVNGAQTFFVRTDEVRTSLSRPLQLKIKRGWPSGAWRWQRGNWLEVRAGWAGSVRRRWIGKGPRDALPG